MTLPVGDEPLADGALLGKVTASQASELPLAAVAAARVYAYELADLSLHRVLTDDRGEFSFTSLPAGIYKIITHKAGFEPVVVLLSRGSAAARQYIEVQLPKNSAQSQKDSFWSLREQVPPDVLRQVEADDRLPVLTSDRSNALDSRMRAQVSTMRGLSDMGRGTARQTSSVGFETHVGVVRLGVTGNFSQVDPQNALLPASNTPGTAQSSAISLRVASQQDEFKVTTLSSRQTPIGSTASPVEFERYGVSWARPVGSSGRSQVTAQYTNESNFYRQGWVTAQAVPDFSQTLRVEGSYIDTLSEDASLETGVRYRQRNGQFNYRGGRFLINDTPDQSVDIFGRGSLRVRPAVVVEYGLYSTLRDGSVSLMPSGGLVLQLGSRWQASTTISHRLDRRPNTEPDTFQPVMFGEIGGAEPAESYLYRLEFTRRLGDDNSFTLGALDRRFDRSLRMYFSSDFFGHLENLFLVSGDRVPEIQASLNHRITRDVMARFESSYGEGGGGIIIGTGKHPYSNQVKYLVTSVTARYEPTSTGVFMAFRRVEQDLAPSGANWRDPAMAATDSLDLQLNQGLSSLFNIAGSWVLRLDFGLDRGASPSQLTISSDEIRKRFLAGVAVQF